MSLSLYDLLRRDIEKMITGICENEQGNIYTLIVQEVEKYIIEIVLKNTKYNYCKAAKILGIGRGTLYRKIKQFKLNKT